MNKSPDFFKNKAEAWRFEDVLNFINKNFNTKNNFPFRIGKLKNTNNQNQRAGIVLAYAQMMNYSFNQVKALFSEHDHFAIAIPETRQGRNILEINNIYTKLLQKGHDQNIKINDFPEYFDIPKNILEKKIQVG